MRPSMRMGAKDGTGAQVFDVKFARHGECVAGADGFAHGFVEQGSDDSAMEVAGVAREIV